MKLAMIGGAGGGAKTYVDDIFSTYVYIGNGSTQTITNGIDLAGNSGLVWIKSRSAATDHQLFDTSRGATYELISNTTTAHVADADTLTSFSSSGFSLGADANVNTNASTYTSWTFRKAPKFFDVVTWSGNNVAQRSIPHSLGISPGLIIVKCTSHSSSSDWLVWHRSFSTVTNNLVLNTNAAIAGNQIFGTDAPTTSTFNLGVSTGGVIDYYNLVGRSYVAYLFSHDTDTDGMIQCGNFNMPGVWSATNTVTLGWEPQFVMYKRTNSLGNWFMFDNIRGMRVSETSQADWNIKANDTAAEVNSAYMNPTPTGFITHSGAESSEPFIYVAIRRSNKPPTNATSIFTSALSAASGNRFTTNFPVDMFIMKHRNNAGGTTIYTRLTREYALNANTDDTEFSAPFTGFDNNTGVMYDNGAQLNVLIAWLFKRAVGVFDVVCYTGTGVARTVSHNLGATPQLMIIKPRSLTLGWAVYSNPTGNGNFLLLNSTDASASDGGVLWNSTTPTSSVFTVGTNSTVNQNANYYVAYLFSTNPGISYIGSYTGNGGTVNSAGTSQTINCGFATGARFVMLKCTSHTSDWVIVDTVRGLVDGSDKVLSINGTATEVTTTDLIDPDNSGFIVNQLASGTTSANFNVTDRTYLVLAFA